MFFSVVLVDDSLHDIDPKISCKAMSSHNTIEGFQVIALTSFQFPNLKKFTVLGTIC